MNLELEELKQKFATLYPQVENLEKVIGVEKLKSELMFCEKETMQNGFWNDKEKSQRVLKQVSYLKNRIQNYENLRKLIEETKSLLELALEENEGSFVEELKSSCKAIEKDLKKQKLEILLNGEYDFNNAILTLHAGAGGTESQDWTEMIYKMYFKWAQNNGFSVSILDFLDGEGVGYKSISFVVKGDNAYGYLKGESGVHRLVRISPFDSSGRRHTSFASVEVIPEIDDNVKVDIADDDIKMDVFRASGAGGQHVNKTSSAVRLTHLPTGIVVTCQNERSQHQNKEVALKLLKSKLMEIKEREHLDKIEDIKGVQKEISWGSQIRSYVFMPYTMAKDHRTNYEVGNINAVMSGEIDGFINAYLEHTAGRKLEEN